MKTPQEIKADELAILFCDPSDIFKPNIKSIRNAKKCVEEIINEIGTKCSECQDEQVSKLISWQEVLNCLNKL